MAAFLALGLTELVSADLQAETVLFLFSGAADIFTNERRGRPQSYVVPVSDPQQIAAMRTFLARRAQGLKRDAMVASLRLALGGDGVNRNYAEPGAPAWSWRVVSVLSVYQLRGNAIDASYIPSRDAAPSMMEQFLRGELGPWQINPNGGVVAQPAPTDVTLIYYPLQMELSPTAWSQLKNVATRGFVGAGERSLIVGFVIEGGRPRNVLVRALGPSLRAFGVEEALADPRIEVYRGAERLAENDNWADGNLNVGGGPTGPRVQAGSPLVPSNEREPGMRLLLEPGSYSMVVRGAGGATGVAMAEVFDLDGVN